MVTKVRMAITNCSYYCVLWLCCQQSTFLTVCIAAGIDQRVYKGAAMRARSRPYADPYMEDTEIVSPWSIDENVQRLLYDDAGVGAQIVLSSIGIFTLFYGTFR